MIVTIIGFMASGKSSVGRKLSGLLSCNFIDLDTYIEDKFGRSIKDIFDNEGEEGFRIKEEEALKEILARDNDVLTIIATGGGLVTRDGCRLLLKNTFCIYLKATAKTIEYRLENRSSVNGQKNISTETGVKNKSSVNGLKNRLSVNGLENTKTETERPMLKCKPGQSLYKRITELMDTRENLYQECADAIVDTDEASVDEVALKCCQIISSLS